jgi:hypothetical protein
MNKKTSRNYVVTAVLTFAVAALLSLGQPPARTQAPAHSSMVISAPHGTQVADGSESNGGKGGGKGNSRQQSVA